MRRSKRHLSPGVSVELDWFGELGEAQLTLFSATSGELEASFGMLGVTLNEAITLYRAGSLALAFEESNLVSGLCRRFCQSLGNVLRSLGEHSQAYKTSPSVAALESADYRSSYGIHTALTNSLWSAAVYSQPKRFLSKVKTLVAMVNHIGGEVCASAELLASSGATTDPEPYWLTMTEGYWDLNTCLRETSVLLKCFLRVLPEDQLPEFRDNIAERKTRKAYQG